MGTSTSSVFVTVPIYVETGINTVVYAFYSCEKRNRPSRNTDEDSSIHRPRQLRPHIIHLCVILRDNTIDDSTCSNTFTTIFYSCSYPRPVHAQMTMLCVQLLMDNPYFMSGNQYGLPLMYQAQKGYYDRGEPLYTILVVVPPGPPCYPSSGPLDVGPPESGGNGLHRGPSGEGPTDDVPLVIMAYLVIVMHLVMVIPLIIEMVMEVLLIETDMDSQDP